MATNNRTTEYRQLFVIIGALFISTIPHVMNVSVWPLLWSVFLWGVALYRKKAGLGILKKWIRLLITAGGVFLVIFTSGRILDRNAGLVLLIVMSGLKPLEIRFHRDRMVAVFIGYFSIISTLFFNDSLYMLLYMMISIIEVTAALIFINAPVRQFKSCLKMASIMTVQSLPLMLLLFFLFPRIPDAFWNISLSKQGTSGFSDTMTPGDISEMVTSDAVAFRVRFLNRELAAKPFYWRGGVLPDFDGRSWSISRPISEKSDKRSQKTDQPVISYRMTIEPHYNKWLFPLEYPVRILYPFAVPVGGNIWKFRRRLRSRITIDGVSSIDRPRLNEDSVSKRYLVLPESNPRAKALAVQWTQKGLTAEEKVKTALSYFRDNQFQYSLSPPLLGENAVDDFLFRTRTGFCEHFASSFTVLMRASGIPARVVVGYLGGERNPIGDYYVIRQSDAHAWSEVWLRSTGWLRVDATTYVAPARVSTGLEAAGASSSLQTILSWIGLKNIYGKWLQIKMAVDAAHQYWSWWFLDYTLEKRAGLIDLAVNNILPITFFIVTGLVLVTLLTLMNRKIRRNRHTTSAQILKRGFDILNAKMSKIGYNCPSHMGPQDFLSYIFQKNSHLANMIEPIILEYIDLRYDQLHPKKIVIVNFIKRIRKLDLKRFPQEAGVTDSD